MPADPRRSKQFIDNLIEKLERYERYVENQLSTAKVNQIQHRLTELNESFSVYQRMLPPYDLMDAELLTEAIRTKIEESYISIVSDLEEKLEELKEARRMAQATEAKPVNPLPVTIGAKLPTVELPTFSGGYLEWNSFIGTFDAIIHDNPSLSERTKFQYLKLSLGGVAAGAVAAVELSDPNYEVARQILKDRFDKPNFICEQHVHALFSSKCIDKPDSNKLLGLVDHFRSHLRSLEALKRPVKQWDDMIVYLMVSKLDADTKIKWDNAAPSTHLPTMDDLCNFLSARAHRIHNEPKFIQRVSTPSKPVDKPTPRNNRPPTTLLNVTNPPRFYCVQCQTSGHTIIRCHKFLHMPIDQRHNFVTSSKLCYNCLRSDHTVDACPVTLRCRHCNSLHHSLLHKGAEGVHHSPSKPVPPYTNSKALSTSANKQSDHQTNNVAISVALSLAKPKSKPNLESFVYLATALVNVIDQDGHSVVGRALLDSGSQLNFMTESFSELLKLPRHKSRSQIHGIGANVISSLSSSTITVKSNTTNFYTTLNVQVLPKITSYQPINPFYNIDSWEIPSNIQLADPEFFKPRDIDLLFGAEIYHQLLAVGQLQFADHLPLLQNTVLGWIVSGKASTVPKSKHFCHLAGDNSVGLSEAIERFWTIENLPHSVKPLSSEESECEEHFTKFTKRDREGRFIVRIPFSSCPSQLGDSKNLTTRRFFNLETRLHKSPELLNSYIKFIDEYKTLGHMEPIDPETIDHPNFYFPHHCVIKPDSSSTKLRVVFDGSAKTTSEKFIQSDLWIHGPAFLLKEPSSWPTLREQFPLPEEMYEMKKATQVVVVSTESSNILQDIKFHNDFRKLRRVIAYMLRLKVKSKFKFSGPLKLEELDQALFTIIRIVQRECFPVEYDGLGKAHFIVKQPHLRSLSLFMDSNHNIRVGGRLQHTALPYTSKHLILLSTTHHFTITLITYYHRKLLHAGPRALLAAVRQSYWPLYGTTICKKVVRDCKECFRARPSPMSQSMGDLPPDRVTASPPFYTVGVDFAGPFYVHYRIRGKPPTKTYLCLFICFVTKAIHLELASDLSSQSFMGCFKRFVATRGLCKRVFSDNGTNFVRANSELRELYALLTSQQLNDELQSMCEEDQIEWRFTPPATPHFGGLHEAGVKLAKFHLRRMMGVARFTYEQLFTLIKQVEAVLNSRPLGPVTNSLDDIDCLIPGHFLIGRPLNALPMPHLTDRPPLDTWKQIEFYTRIFWKRWSTEYLQSLQQRTKWTRATRNLSVGELVVLNDENQPPRRWRLGRVIKVYNGHDGIVRVADVKTANGILKRGIAKICRLPQDTIEMSDPFQGGENVHASTTSSRCLMNKTENTYNLI